MLIKQNKKYIKFFQLNNCLYKLVPDKRMITTQVSCSVKLQDFSGARIFKANELTPQFTNKENILTIQYLQYNESQNVDTLTPVLFSLCNLIIQISSSFIQMLGLNVATMNSGTNHLFSFIFLRLLNYHLTLPLCVVSSNLILNASNYICCFRSPDNHIFFLPSRLKVVLCTTSPALFLCPACF